MAIHNVFGIFHIPIIHLLVKPRWKLAKKNHIARKSCLPISTSNNLRMLQLANWYFKIITLIPTYFYQWRSWICANEVDLIWKFAFSQLFWSESLSISNVQLMMSFIKLFYSNEKPERCGCIPILWPKIKGEFIVRLKMVITCSTTVSVFVDGIFLCLCRVLGSN